MAMKEVPLKSSIASSFTEQNATKSIDKGLKSVNKKRKMERSKIEIHPGKKGGQFNLIDGLKITVSENAFVGKKDSICGVFVPPNKRSEYCPTLREQEKLISEMVVLLAKPRLHQPLQIQMRHMESFDPANFTIRVLHRDVDAAFTEIAYTELENGWVHFSTAILGVFFLLSSPKFEKIEVNPNGGLYNLKVHPLMSIRIAKRSYDSISQCDISILPIHAERIALCRSMNFFGNMDVANLSSFFNFEFPDVELRRAATLKLPLPDWASAEDTKRDNIVVMQCQRGQWNAVESELKFTKTTVTFDVKILSRYCLVQLSEGGKLVRAKSIMSSFDDYNRKVCGEILAFVLLEEHKWHLWVELARLNQVEKAITDRVMSKGFSILKVTDEFNGTSQIVQDNNLKKDRQAVSKDKANCSHNKSNPPSQNHTHFANGAVFQVRLQGDFNICGSKPNKSAEKVHFSDNMAKTVVNTSATEKIQFQFHEEFADNYCRFEIEPGVAAQKRAKQMFANSENGTANADIDLEVFLGKVTCEMQNSSHVQSFNLEIDFEDLKEYLNLRPVATEGAAAAPSVEDVVKNNLVEQAARKKSEDKADIPLPLATQQIQKETSQSFVRLTKPKTNALQITKEPKVLSGRSLQNLSKNLNQGLTLAVHLNLPDSIITGIGFDALSTGCSLTEVTYKILLQWKRTEKDKSKLVPMLVEALKVMGRTDLAEVVEDRDRQNIELSVDCFKL